MKNKTFAAHAALLIFAVVGSMFTQAEAATCPPTEAMDPTPLPPGNGEDLEVTGPCTVGAGAYHYGNVNIYNGGSLTFEDALIDFWATSIFRRAHQRPTGGEDLPDPGR